MKDDATLNTTTNTPVRSEPLPLEFPGAHYIGEEEIEAAVRVLRTKSLFRYYGIDPQGEAAALEREFARFIGRDHALAVTSGIGALHVALAALGVGPGPEVIVPAYLWVAVLGAVVNRGAIPVVADSLFERSMLRPIPSCLTRADEDDIIRAFEKVLHSL